MSRSFKHTAGWKDQACRGMKRYANKKVRHTVEVPNGMAYKKLFESWDISDYASLYWNKEKIKRCADENYDGKVYRYYMK